MYFFCLFFKNKIAYNMQKILIFVEVLLFSTVVGQDSVMVKKSNLETRNSKTALSDYKKPTLNYRKISSLELIIDVRNFSESQISNKERKKQRKEPIQKRKDKSGKFTRQKSKPQKHSNNMSKQLVRKNEKAILVRSKTIELLKKGLRILSAGENHAKSEDGGASRMNGTLLKEILSSTSTFSRHDDSLSTTGSYKLPVRLEVYKTKIPLPNSLPDVATLEASPDKKQIQKQNKKQSKNFSQNYNYEYDMLLRFPDNKTKDIIKLYETIHYENVETVNVDHAIEILLKQIVRVLKNLTNSSNRSCFAEVKAHFEDQCQKWLSCKEAVNLAFTQDTHNLPSCPCVYPSTIFYEEMIWDKNQKKYFRWRDASNEAERLDIYKPGAAYCIRSLLSQKSTITLSSQQCCYDRSLQLLTRGSGAGTINFISPEISKKLHYVVDVVPWKLCKGDFTRYNTARNVNNGNNCSENPKEEEYQLQRKLSKFF